MNSEEKFQVSEGSNLSESGKTNRYHDKWEQSSFAWHVSWKLGMLCSTVPGREVLCRDADSGFKHVFPNWGQSLLDLRRGVCDGIAIYSAAGDT